MYFFLAGGFKQRAKCVALPGSFTFMGSFIIHGCGMKNRELRKGAFRDL